MHGYVPEGFFETYLSGEHWYAVPLAVFLAVPMYANAAGIVPRCRSLCGKRREPRHRTCLHDVGSRYIFARGYHVKESNEHASHRDFLQHSCLRHHPPWLAVQLLFIGNERPEIQLASVMYNATTDDEEHLADHHYKIDNSSYQD